MRAFVDPAAVLGKAAVDLASGAERSADGWSRIERIQRWFDCDVKARYTFDPEHRLQRIDLSAPSADPLFEELQKDLGPPDEAGQSPQFLNSTSYARWVRGSVTFVMEDYAPGCEIGITPTR